MITKKTPEEIEILREGGRHLARVLRKLSMETTIGATFKDLNDLGDRLIRDTGDTPAFLGYTPDGMSKPYPASICISANDAIVHGIPTVGDDRVKDGDLITLDAGLVHNGLFVDAAVTIAVGDMNKRTKELVMTTKEALEIGISMALVGNHVGDISSAIEGYIRARGFSIFKELVGHGVGYAVHEDPYIPNVGKSGTGPVLEEGMVIAIEPMVGLGSDEIILDANDGYTYRTKDGSVSAHFEHTIAITAGGPVVLTEE